MIISVCACCGVEYGLEYDENQHISDVTYSTNKANKGKHALNGFSELISIQMSTRLLQPRLRENVEEAYKIRSWKTP